MKYRNKRRYAAIWVLEQLSKHNKYHFLGAATFSTEAKNPAHIRAKDEYKVRDLIKISPYNSDTVCDAIYFLISKNYIDNTTLGTDITQISINIKEEGINALRDELLEEDIKDYNSDRYYRNARWLLPILAIIISVLSLILNFTCNKNQPNNIQQISIPQNQEDTLRNRATQSKDSLGLIEKDDTSHANNGQ